MSASYDVAAWRRRIPLLRTKLPMNACSRAPLLDSVRDAATTWLDSWDARGMDWDLWIDEVDAARLEFARLIGCDVEEVSLATSVSQATNSFLSALEFGDRPVIVASEAEFPTVGQALVAQSRRGAVVRWVPFERGVVRFEDWASALDDQVGLVSITHGCYQSGYRQDLARIVELARARGALTFVDAYQTLGVEPIDVRKLGVDVLTGGTLKYLMGAPGVAFMYVRKALAQRLEPRITGWFGRRDPMDFDPRGQDWAVGAHRFDLGTPPDVCGYMARAGLSAIREIGPSAIRAWTRELAGHMIELGQRAGYTVLGPTDPELRTPMTAFVCPGDSHAVEVELLRRGVLASGRGPVIRMAPHFYSTADDVERAMDALAGSFRAVAKD